MEVLANILAAGILFIMLFFSISIARNVHKALDKVNAGILLRILFPEYFFWGLILSLISGLLFLLEGNIFQSIVMFIIASMAAFSRYHLVTKINKNRDLMIQGDLNAGKEFSSLHKTSVSINIIQIILLLTILIYSTII